MGDSVRPPDMDFVRRVAILEAKVAALSRTPSGPASIGPQFLRPAVKAGTPSDVDYGALPVGSQVIDTTGSRIWVRTAAGSWKSVVIA